MVNRNEWAAGVSSLLVLACALCADSPARAQEQAYVSEVWSPDLGNGTYKNPVINADYSDPDVCAVGNDFYMTASSFACAPGLPVLHSTDLVNWEIVNYALDRLVPEDFYDVARHGKGVWAPSIRYHKGEFYIYWGDPDFGVYMVKTDDPRGKWSEPVLVKKAKGIIDPCPLWDEDGRCYLAYAWAASRAQINSVICVAEMNAEGTRVTGPSKIVYDGNDDVNHTAEGPKFYKKDGFYYLLFPAGGVEMGWQMAARSKQVYGPYEARRVMEQGGTPVNGPHQGGMGAHGIGRRLVPPFSGQGLLWPRGVARADEVGGRLAGHRGRR